MSKRHSNEFLLINALVLPMWAAMILFPRSRATRRLMDWSSPLLTGMSALYAGLLGRSVVVGEPLTNPIDGDAWRRVLASPEGFVAGWTHYLVFDLFVGRWIWRTALDEERGCRLALLLALFAGPLGLLVFDLQRRRAPGRSRAELMDAQV